MPEPDFTQFRRLVRQGNLVPVYETVRADLLTPVSAYLRLARRARYACLLESVEGGEKIARYTFVGANPEEIFRFRKGQCLLESQSSSLDGRGSAQRGQRGKDQLSASGGSAPASGESKPLLALRQLVKRYQPVRVAGLPPLVGGTIGYFAYDLVRQFERLPDTTRDDLAVDDIVMMFFLGLVVFDHVQHRLWIVRNVFTGGPQGRLSPAMLRAKYDAAVRGIAATRRLLERAAPEENERAQPSRSVSSPRIASNFSKPSFLAAVRKSKQYIRAGDIFQIVLSQRFAARIRSDPFEIYRALRVINPSPYMYFLKLGDCSIAGSSPEMLVKVQGRAAFYHPIAGTEPRGRSEEEDRLLEARLLADPKERAEHVMLVDLGRNDLGRVSEYGSVRVERLMYVERYSHVMHLVSSLRSTLRADADCFDALAACFPAGTLSGAPKIRAMEIIDELEPTRRGIYGGAILYLDFAGNLDSCIAIRTLLVKSGMAYVQAGAGIVADSVPEREYQESVNKAKALFRAMAMVHG
jgi:anthranilate synthase component I